MTMNGSRAVLLPLLACQSFNISKTALGTGPAWSPSCLF